MDEETEHIEPEENLPPVESKPVHADDLDDLLAQYGAPMEVNKPDTIDGTETERIVALSNEGNTPLAEEKLGNPKYYQRGKKAGQLRPGYEPAKESMTVSGDLLDAGMFLTLIDTILPMVIAFANNSFSVIKIDPDKLQLTEKQKRQLEPIVTQVVKKLSLTGDPVFILLASLASMYGIQYWSLRVEAKAEFNEQQKTRKETT